MAYLYTETGYNMFDMLSLVQKAIRRSDYQHAGFAAKQLKGKFRTTMWNRLFVTASEDCFGVLQKELVALRAKDDALRDDANLSNAVALMCKAKKSRDACYFACNFVLANRKPRDFTFDDNEIFNISCRMEDVENRIKGKAATSLFQSEQIAIGQETPSAVHLEISDEKRGILYNALALQKAIKHRDMDMAGYHTNYFRENCRNQFWVALLDYALRNAEPLYDEINALRISDDLVNKRKNPLDKDNIFVAKAVMLLCYYEDDRFDSVLSNPIIKYDELVDWSRWYIQPIDRCELLTGAIPEWVYDCHTLKGKRMGKTDWDMTVSEQAALTPLQLAYFDEASWLYTYEQDEEIGVLDKEGMKPIREFAKTHSVNPVEVIPYE